MIKLSNALKQRYGELDSLITRGTRQEKYGDKCLYFDFPFLEHIGGLEHLFIKLLGKLFAFLG